MTDVSRRQLLAGAAGLAAVGGFAAACGSSSSSPSTGTGTGAAGAPKRGGNFRLGVTGGGSTHTVRLPLKPPHSTGPQTLGSHTRAVVPTGYKGYPAQQIGTGAYKLKSCTPGQQSVHERNPNYWRTGEPYFDTVTITDFSDST